MTFVPKNVDGVHHPWISPSWEKKRLETCSIEIYRLGLFQQSMWLDEIHCKLKDKTLISIDKQPVEMFIANIHYFHLLSNFPHHWLTRRLVKQRKSICPFRAKLLKSTISSSEVYLFEICSTPKKPNVDCLIFTWNTRNLKKKKTAKQVVGEFGLLCSGVVWVPRLGRSYKYVDQILYCGFPIFF